MGITSGYSIEKRDLAQCHSKDDLLYLFDKRRQGEEGRIVFEPTLRYCCCTG